MKEDLTGMTFGRLTVIKLKSEDKEGNSLWICECCCVSGKEVIAVGRNLKKGHTQSCGCLQKEAIKRTGLNNKKYNEYDLSNEYGIGITSNGYEFYFDLEDYELIKNYC
jgi:hypothetical protein